MSPSYHIPVLRDEVLLLLDLSPGAAVIDATVGDGGHAEAMLELIAPNGKLLGIDLDSNALEAATARLKRFGPRVTLRQGNFKNIRELAKVTHIPKPAAILFDLGLRSHELESSGRGFSFLRDEPLDMRFDPTTGPTAADIINTTSRDELERILREYGEERRARVIVGHLLNARRFKPLTTTFELVSAVGGPRGKIHPATRTFQALRIAVNDELGALKGGLVAARDLVAPAGRIGVISFHSLEDRIVKQTFRSWAAAGAGTVVTKKPVRPTAAEAVRNPRSRSARFRVFLKV